MEKLEWSIYWWVHFILLLWAANLGDIIIRLFDDRGRKYIALARQKYQELQNLKKKNTFYDYEKMFVEIWTDLGRQVLQKNLCEVPADRRKKRMTTRSGKVKNQK
jgi:hypothetical protein